VRLLPLLHILTFVCCAALLSTISGQHPAMLPCVGQLAHEPLQVKLDSATRPSLYWLRPDENRPCGRSWSQLLQHIAQWQMVLTLCTYMADQMQLFWRVILSMAHVS
jgi:hypothetical protein